MVDPKVGRAARLEREREKKKFANKKEFPIQQGNKEANERTLAKWSEYGVNGCLRKK